MYGLRLRPDHAEDVELQPEFCGVHHQPISIVDNLRNDNEEDEYEEMDEEEEDEGNISTLEATPIRQEVESAEICDTYSAESPHCLVCGRTSTPKTRLFKWPDDLQLRRAWLAFFHMGMSVLENCKVPYICNIHFDANQFLYEGDHIYWNREPFPRYRQRRSVLAEPFPWELKQSFAKKHPQNLQSLRPRYAASHEHRVTFRESYFKSKLARMNLLCTIKSSTTLVPAASLEHANDIVELNSSQSQCTKNRGMNDARVKDVIRTIHIKDDTIQSRGDPFWGHHFACRPFSSAILPSPAHQEPPHVAFVEYNDDFLSERSEKDMNGRMDPAVFKGNAIKSFQLMSIQIDGKPDHHLSRRHHPFEKGSFVSAVSFVPSSFVFNTAFGGASSATYKILAYM
ncbi:unnamed protein product [Nippostrongylus brasiliensis]|uniref:THAP-type domain-containing protein n=1 Tax=Nippostrongylus brasiliensis TaxID=27835 RepID=A0A0N4XUM7_NIPBR|nr:unnamed protein product [Nippostrongylus brasiliensis]